MTASVSRRHFLALSTCAVAGGVESIVAARRAPAHAQGTRLHLLQWSHFVPAADTLFEAQAKEFGKQASVEVKIERINQNDLQARATAAIQSGAGPDIIILANNHAHLYEASLVDVSDVAEDIGGKQGGWYDYAKVNCVSGSRWIGVPQFIISWAITYREDWFKEAGFEYPKTWDDFRKVGRAMKAKGKPFGQAFGHSINDPNNWRYPLIWMWGGMEVRQDGRGVVLDGKNTLEAVKFNAALWTEVFDEGGLAWDDSNNNRAFLSSDLPHRQRAEHLRGRAAEVPRRLPRHQPRPLPAGSGRTLLLAARVEFRGHAVFQEPGRGQGLHPVLHGPRALRALLRDDGHLRDPRHQSVPRPPAVEERKNYGEKRIICYGLLAGRVVVVGYTPRGADRHVFSMRKANEREKARIAPLLEV